MTDNAEGARPATPGEAGGGTGPVLQSVEHVGALAAAMGITITEAGPQRLTGTMPVEGNTQPLGLLHGGASAVLAETLGSIGAHLAAGEGRTAVGIELSITHHAPARSGTVTGIANAIAIGRAIATYEIAIYDEAERRLATARLTCLLRSLPGAAG